MGSFQLVVTVNERGTADLAASLQNTTAERKRENVQGAIEMLNQLVGATKSGSVIVSVPTASATGTVTCASAAAADTVTVNGVTFTAVASGATGNQFNVGGGDNAAATSLAAAINASATALAQLVTASANGAVVTLTAKAAGANGNANTLASSNGSRLAVSGARLTGGTDNATATTLTF